MGPRGLALISTLVNLWMGAFKLIVGHFSGSISLMAEALHSLLDVVSSFITFLGIRAAKKPADVKHPYGYERYESLASLAVVLLLFASAVWILVEAGRSILVGETAVEFSLWGIILMVLSAIANEVMARFKFSFGNKFSSLALVADAEHSRADVISSLAVLFGLVLVRFYPSADSILAVLVALYIFHEAYQLGSEAVGSLVDTADQELEKNIRMFLKKNGLSFSEIKTRRIGSISFAEVALLYDPKAKLDEVAAFTKRVEDKLLARFPEIKQVSLLVKPHDFGQGVIRSRFGGRFRLRRGLRQIGPKPRGRRVVIPLENGEIASAFGSAEYLVVDTGPKGGVRQKLKSKNPYFEVGGAGHGTKFVRSVGAEKVITKQIGESAAKSLAAYGVEVEVVDEKTTLKDLGYG